MKGYMRSNFLQIRRLYDIANVFSSLGLIKKVTLDLDTRKPAFRWIGKDGLDDFVNELNGKENIMVESKNVVVAKTQETETEKEKRPDLLTNIYNALLNLPKQEESLNKKRSSPQNINSFEGKIKKKLSSSK